MNKEKGFTLIELLIVLSIVTITSLFAIPKMYKTVIKQEQHHYIQLFSSDLFYIQNHALYTSKSIEINPFPSGYRVLSSSEIRERPSPDKLYLFYYPKKSAFSRHGTLKNPNTYLFRYPEGQYKIVLPFGKGREYIDE